MIARHGRLLAVMLCTLVGFASQEIVRALKEPKCSPSEGRGPAGLKLKVGIDNQGATAEEFESAELNREKIIAPKSKASVWIGPLKPGKYPFIGEFNQATAQGVIIAE